MKNRAMAHPLSQLDAFFVAYQERAGVLMQHGVEAEIKGEVRRELLLKVLTHLAGRWPRIGQTLRKGATGLRWRGECRVEEMLRVTEESGALHRWRNQPINPFREPPFQLLYIPGSERSMLAYRSHHSVADGEAFNVITTEAMRVLAVLSGGETPERPEQADNVKLTEVISPSSLWREGKLPGMWRYMRWLGAEAKRGRSMRLALRACETGPVATCERLLDEIDFGLVKERAAGAGVAPAWLSAAAWVRAIGAWNSSRSTEDAGPVSLEVPVSFRPRRSVAEETIGNFISPLVLFGDPRQPLEQVALDLRKQLRTGLRERSHLGVPLFTAPARFLPWPLFRRLAVNQSSTGFATSHFTWLEEKRSYKEYAALSRGALQVLDLHIYTPVCLHMGAALAVLPLDSRAKLSLTYRLTAFSGADAEALLDLLVAELQGERRLQRRAV